MTPTLAPPEEFEDPNEEQAPDEEQEDYGEANEDLPQQLVDAVKAAIVEFQGQEKFTRRTEVRSDRTNRFYERGYQHLWWGQNGCSMATPGGMGQNSQGQSIQFPTYINDYNLYFPYLRILTSVLTQNPPGVNFQPIDPSVTADIDKAKAAEAYAKAFDRMNDINDLQTQIVRMMGVSGRTVSWTRTETDGQRFGYEEDGSPKTFQRTTIHGTLETKVPILAREFDKNVPYVFIYDDPDVQVAKAQYPKFAVQIKESMSALNESLYDRTARLGVLNGSRNQGAFGDSFNHTTSRINAFLRPSAFTGERFEVALEQGGGTLKEKLQELFPEGGRFVFVGDTYVGSYAESMDDHIEIQFPYPGDGMFRMAFMDAMIVVQDRFNDNMNWAAEKFDTGAGALWVNADEVEIDAITSQRAAPNAIRAKKARAGAKLDDEFFKEEDPQLPATLVEFIQMLQSELPQFMLAAPPAIFGAAMEDNKTASGYAQARSQAMGQLGIIWARIQRMFARIRYQSALAASKNDQMQGQLTIPGSAGQQSITVDMDQLKKGNFGCYPDEDSSFPESTQQKRATFQTIITLAEGSPLVAQMLDNPDNVELAKRMWGLSELVLIPAEARNKQVFEIEKLLEQSPIPPDPQAVQGAMVQHAAQSIQARADGQPDPPMPDPMSLMQPSIPVDELDYHQFEFDKCQEWLSSAARRTEDTKGNQLGVMNVKLHALAHKAAMIAQMPPPMPPVGPVGPAKKGALPPTGPPKAPTAPPAQPAI